ncbi:MAG: aldo/keto reductase [Planctomycetaceae bacterium]
MLRRPIGQTGLSISEIAMGCGPVSALMTGTASQQQLAVVRQAIAAGINWFDTAPGYGDGQSERSLGLCLAACDPHQESQIGTKVRLLRNSPDSFRTQILESVKQSLLRLQRPAVALLQLHNAITTKPDEQPFSVTEEEVLGPGGVADCFEELRQAGQIQAAGLTGTGDTTALTTVISSQRFQTIQLPLNLLHSLPNADPQPLQLLAACQVADVSVLAIRIFAAGALLGRPPGAHTLRTPFFPLALYQRDAEAAEQLCRGWTFAERLLRTIEYPLSQPAVVAAIVGIADPDELLSIRMQHQTLPEQRKAPRD